MKKVKQLIRGCGGMFMGCGGLAAAAAIGLVALILLAWLVWPTLYRHETLTLPDGQTVPVRFHRLTGDAERLGEAGWEPWLPELAGGPAGPVVALPTEELARLGDVRVRVDFRQRMVHLFLHNGGEMFAVTVATARIRAQTADGERLYEKIYSFHAREPMLPGQSGELLCLDAADLFSALAQSGDATVAGEVLSAQGFRPAGRPR
jgi:hypothetical protein